MESKDEPFYIKIEYCKCDSPSTTEQDQANCGYCGKYIFTPSHYSVLSNEVASLRAELAALRKENEWVSVKDRPLFVQDNDIWICTEDGDKEFIAAVPYTDIKKPGEKLYWIRHCVIIDRTGLCVVTDDDNEPAGWNMEDITHWRPLPLIEQLK